MVNAVIVAIYTAIAVGICAAYAYGLQRSLQEYSDPKGKSVKELFNEQPSKQRIISYYKCFLGTAVVMIAFLYYYRILAVRINVPFQENKHWLLYLVMLSTACVISVVTDYKYAVISNIVTYTTITFGLLFHGITVATQLSIGVVDNVEIGTILFNLGFLIVIYLFTRLDINGIGGGDLKLFLAISLGLPFELLPVVIITTCILAIANYLGRGVYSHIKTKKWTTDKTIRVGIWLGLSAISCSIYYIVLLSR